MSESSILVTGGAGYIGSHTVRMLAEQAGKKVIVLDNLVFGHPEAIVSAGVKFVEGDMADADLVERIFSENKIEAVVHFAAFAYVGESVTDPLKYYRNNTAAPLTILEAMKRHGCQQFIFSSTCATYGDPVRMPIDESHPQNPINPYGASKWMLERVLKDCESAYGIRSVWLRYFNASGCSTDGVIGEDHAPETHLIPLILQAIKGERGALTVFGTDYDTPDGTCIRDYIHVDDLAKAHLQALDYLQKGSPTVACNLGTGTGFSVKEMIDAAEKVTGKKVPVEYGDRRAGDPSKLIADASFAKATLGWEADYKDVTAIIETAWKWFDGPRGGKY
jgi:UDP-glucose 4-epimerase